MTRRGCDRPLHILPFDHRGSFEVGMFGWDAPLPAARRFGFQRTTIKEPCACNSE
jgi:hypothetical protein